MGCSQPMSLISLSCRTVTLITSLLQNESVFTVVRLIIGAVNLGPRTRSTSRSGDLEVQ